MQFNYNYFADQARLRQATLTLALIICVGVAISIISWAKEPEMRVLINDLRQVDAVQVTDLLEQHTLWYKTDSDSHMLYIADDDSNYARLLLSTIGIEINYPKYSPLDIKTLELLNLEPEGEQAKLFYQQPVVIKMYRLSLSALIIIVLILVVMRPMLRIWIYPESINQSEEDK
jgi:flagellar biosynthesis/type III secretory pathway M-ring protein FliF/YscJ